MKLIFDDTAGGFMKLYRFELETERECLCNITSRVMQAVKESGVRGGTCTVFCPHTTAGITVNENADPDVQTDMLLGLRKAFPDRNEFLHSEGNSSAHLRASCVGSSAVLIVNENRLLLGRWQAGYFCEFVGPRNRTFYVHICGEE